MRVWLSYQSPLLAESSFQELSRLHRGYCVPILPIREAASPGFLASWDGNLGNLSTSKTGPLPFSQ